MKNLFLPFVVMALFALGSCGDEASINPPVNKKDTTKNQDTTHNQDTTQNEMPTSYLIKNVNDLHLSIPIIISGGKREVLNFVYPKTYSPGWTMDKKVSREGFYRFFIKNSAVDISLSFNVNAAKKELTNISFSHQSFHSAYNVLKYSFTIDRLQGYISSKYLMAVIKSESLQNAVDNVQYTYQYTTHEVIKRPNLPDKSIPVNHSYSFVSLDKFTNANTFGISLEIE
ncbi:MAG TPA: hypothetical protein VEC36_06440 [Patescibacteria group bacterium]|nr:hypothetical protein [Patescibacteria group bacterium]